MAPISQASKRVILGLRHSGKRWDIINRMGTLGTVVWILDHFFVTLSFVLLLVCASFIEIYNCVCILAGGSIC